MDQKSFAKVVYLLALVATIIGLNAFGQSRQGNNTSGGDSIKLQNFNKNDDARQFDRLDLQLKNLDLQMQQLNETMKKLDFSKIQLELESGLKKLEKENIQEKINEALKDIKWDELKSREQQHLAELSKIRMGEIKKSMQKVKVELENQKLEMRSLAEIDHKKIRIQVNKAMKEAKNSISKAREEINNTRDFTDALQRDGLIDKTKRFRIEVKDGELFINGNKQSKEISDKYKHFYNKKSFSMQADKPEDTITN